MLMSIKTVCWTQWVFLVYAIDICVYFISASCFLTFFLSFFYLSFFISSSVWNRRESISAVPSPITVNTLFLTNTLNSLLDLVGLPCIRHRYMCLLQSTSCFLTFFLSFFYLSFLISSSVWNRRESISTVPSPITVNTLFLTNTLFRQNVSLKTNNLFFHRVGKNNNYLSFLHFYLSQV